MKVVIDIDESQLTGFQLSIFLDALRRPLFDTFNQKKATFVNKLTFVNDKGEETEWDVGTKILEGF